MLGADAELFELAALVSDPGAPRQPVHPDTPFMQTQPEPQVVTAFVALQDIDESMGPTFFLPGTHVQQAHDTFNKDESSKVELLREAPRRLGLQRAGDATLFDSRLLHGGGANRSRRRRMLLYFSFKRANARGVPTGTLLRELRGSVKLSDALV